MYLDGFGFFVVFLTKHIFIYLFIYDIRRYARRNKYWLNNKSKDCPKDWPLLNKIWAKKHFLVISQKYLFSPKILMI